MGGDGDGSQEARLLRALEGLLALEVAGLEAAMEGAAQQLAETLAADKADVFLHEPAAGMLVAVGTSDTPMSRREHELGLDRLPLAGGGRTVGVFRDGRSFRDGRADRDPGELRGVVEGLGVRSSLGAPLELAGERRGVVLTSSTRPDFFAAGDLHFLEAVARWVGLAAARAAQVERLAARAAEEGYRAAAAELVGVLSPRQREVAGLIAAGLTNQEIAERLVLTRGTVTNHVEHILRRLGLRSRTEVAVWASERGLGPSGQGDDGGG